MDYNKIIKESLKAFENTKVITDPTILGKTISELDNTENEVSDAYGVTQRVIVAADEFTTDPETSNRFACQSKAENFLEEKGYSVGHMQSGSPMGFLKGNYDVMKWRNLDKNDKDRLDGILVCYGNNRCIAYYFNHPE